MGTKELDIKELFNIILKRLWIIIIIPVIAVAVAGYVNFKVFVPTYQASTTLLIAGLSSITTNTDAANTGATNTGNRTLSFEDIVAGQTLVSEYSEIINSSRVTSAVIKNLNDSSISEESLRDMISIGAVNDTRIIAISIADTDPVRAAKIADVVAAAFTDAIRTLYKIDNVNIIDKAEIPINPIAPTKKKNIAMAGLVGLVLSIGIIFLLEFMDNTIKTSDDVERYLGLNVIGSIPVNTVDKGKNK
jgi:capsular polysaccharide biosynthesis protein